MRHAFACGTLLALGALQAVPASADVIYNNLTPNNQMAIASRTDTNAFEIDAGDEFLVGTRSAVTSASFVGLMVPSASGANFSISQVVAEIYRVFPLDSDTVRTPNVPTRNNSPSDVA